MKLRKLKKIMLGVIQDMPRNEDKATVCESFCKVLEQTDKKWNSQKLSKFWKKGCEH